MSNLAISTVELRKQYGTRVAVDGLDLAVPTGTIFGFLGPNGSGKSTTIRMLLGLSKPTEGHIRLLDHEVPRGLAPAFRRIGAVLEDPSFYPTMSALDNLKVLSRTAGDRAAHGRGQQLLERVGLGERLHDHVGKFSRGMKQRLALAAALLKDPDLLILDEPATGLDPTGVRDIRDLIVELGREGKTIFFSSHALSEVERVCDQVAIVRAGRLVATGTLESLMSQEQTTVVVQLGKSEVKAAQRVGRSKGWEAEAGEESITVKNIDSRRVNADLVGAGITPKELLVRRHSLEDVYLELTGEPPGEEVGE